MIVVPKRKHEMIVNELKIELENKKTDMYVAIHQRDDYKNAYEETNKLYKQTLEEKAKIQRENQLLEVSSLRKQENICKLEYRIEQLKSELSGLNNRFEKEKYERDNKICRLKELLKSKTDKRILKYENIARKTKKTRIKEKAEKKIIELELLIDIKNE